MAGATVHRPRDLLDLNPSRKDGIRTTNILRTLCDLGAVDPVAVPGAVGHVVTTGMASPAALVAAIKRHGRRGRPGVPALREALGDWVLDGKPVDSVLEPAMRRLLERHRLPPAEFHPRIGGYEVDFRMVDSPLILECDGWATHGRDRRQFERDRPRDADLAALGFVVLRFTYRAIMKRPAREADRIRRNVARWAPHLLPRRDRFPSGLPATPMGAWELLTTWPVRSSSAALGRGAACTGTRSPRRRRPRSRRPPRPPGRRHHCGHDVVDDHLVHDHHHHTTTTAMTTTSATQLPTTASVPTDPVSIACATLRSGVLGRGDASSSPRTELPPRRHASALPR